jgi:Bacterial capsule synthesis protein PGA_cap
VTDPASLSIAAVGDLSFEGSWSDRPSLDWFSDVGPRFRQSDLVVGNLESPLLTSGQPIEGKCTLRGCPEWADVLRGAGITLVSLANNHVMDYGAAGLMSTFAALDRAGVGYVGAGLDRERACAPTFFSVRGIRIAILARTSVAVTAPTYAGQATPGVAFLDPAETTAAIQSCRRDADVRILLLHWGLEEYRYPSPAQRQLARQLVRAGADIIIGHHPHVSQGIERVGDAVVAYSLGNFVFSSFEWEYRRDDGTRVKTLSKLSTQNQRGLVLEVSRSNGRPTALAVHPTRIENGAGVLLDKGRHRTREVTALSAALRMPAYRLWWHAYAARREWTLRLGPSLSGSRLRRSVLAIRPHHVKSLITSIRRSARIVFQKSTNPYE